MHEQLDRNYHILSEYVEVAPTDAKLNDCFDVVTSYAERQFAMVVYCSSTFNKCAVEAAMMYPNIKHLSVSDLIIVKTQILNEVKDRRKYYYEQLSMGVCQNLSSSIPKRCDCRLVN